ncbi:hypothetical protein [Lentzea sp. NBRC 102530]|uniref:hypothetical protein n=1 Tax=Lentzea sp. NBRC 102530 TaxID=3032201 RepID=UPI0024A5504C|nr:hypothetical protein [Lentzea sp. NBRC 102530]GLY46990.1 hypothetical protein Lesp01_06460 [Lentzea sp. NBRC 102530]
MTPVLVRLRPVVQATPTPDGLHLRGWTSSCTLSGGRGLWKVWQRLAPQLVDGVPRADLEAPADAAPGVRAAVTLIVEQLWEHDMLVETPGWGADAPSPEVAAWLESAAVEPVAAWGRLRGVTVVVAGNEVLADAARRAAEAVGLAVAEATEFAGSAASKSVDVQQAAGTRWKAEPASAGGFSLPTSDLCHSAGGFPLPATDLCDSPGELFLSAAGLTVVAECGTEVGYVLPPTTETSPSFNTEVTMRIRARIGLTGEPAGILPTLIGSAAVHRLVCAVAGLPDPTPEAVHPMALVAHASPLTATYHPVLQGPPPADPWRALDALTDTELGPVDTPEFGALPQVPANLATSGTALGIGTTADAARVNAALNALKVDGVIGIDDVHARGAALRRKARHLRGEPADPAGWTGDPTAHRWWKALTARFGVPAVVRVERLADGVHKAEVRDKHGVLAWAVEATAADAVAFAALAATGHAQAGRTGTAHLNGAAPAKVTENPAWVTKQWHWPAHVRDHEEQLQQAIANLPGVDIHPVELDPELRAAGLRAYR